MSRVWTGRIVRPGTACTCGLVTFGAVYDRRKKVCREEGRSYERRREEDHPHERRREEGHSYERRREEDHPYERRREEGHSHERRREEGHSHGRRREDSRPWPLGPGAATPRPSGDVAPGGYDSPSNGEEVICVGTRVTDFTWLSAWREVKRPGERAR